MLEPHIIAHLSKDKTLKTVLDTTTISFDRDTPDVYLALLRAISAQQLSAKAARTIFKRFLMLFEDEYPLPEVLKEMDIDTLRTAGLSKPKANYMLNVAHYFSEHKLMEKDWDALSDDAIIDNLVNIKGVGKWTVQMILIFSLGREDVFPIDDLVVRQNIVQLYDIQAVTKKELYKSVHEVAEQWQPYRSIASRYLWAWGR